MERKLELAKAAIDARKKAEPKGKEKPAWRYVSKSSIDEDRKRAEDAVDNVRLAYAYDIKAAAANERSLLMTAEIIEACESLPQDFYSTHDNFDKNKINESLAAMHMLQRQPATRASLGGQPISIAEVKRLSDWPKWKDAMTEEWCTHVEMGTFVRTELPQGKNLVGCKWVLTVKMDLLGRITRYKARLVGQGYTQVHGIDFEETFSPVVKLTALQMMLGAAIIKGYRVKLMDVKTAYLNGTNEHEIYMTIPIDFRDPTDGPNTVLKVIKSLYGLKASGREWFKTLYSRLAAFGFRQSDYEDSVFIQDRTKAILLTYVDDLVLLSPTEDIETEVANMLRSQFTMTDNPPGTAFLGIALEPLVDGRRGYALSQEHYIKTILKRFDLENAKVATQPLPSKIDQIHPSPPSMTATNESKSEYLSKIGSLLWVSQVTRPDISFAVNFLARFSANPSEYHHQLANNVLRYLKGTASHTLEMTPLSTKGPDEKLYLQLHSDADFGGDRQKGRSTTGYTVFLNGMVIDWKSQLQSTVALSSTDAEMIALSTTSRRAIGLRNLLKDVFEGYDQENIPIYTDSATSLVLSGEFANHEKIKHLRQKEQYIQKARKDGEVDIIKIASKLNTADYLTKSKPAADIQRFKQTIGLGRPASKRQDRARSESGGEGLRRSQPQEEEPATKNDSES
ncbi:hypothetical protein CBS101457_001094 [Exobasidium rhododendri]|nr:hypothetical protein CBS101457_001094 [Exobasidium rhododendri]